MESKRISILAFFTAFAITIFVLENFIPKPFPFLRLGLANVIVLFVLINFSFKEALLITIGKSVIGGFFTGMVFTPILFISLGGSLGAVIMMYIFVGSKFNFSIIGISIIGAVFHNIIQIIIVRILLITDNSIFNLTPLLIIWGIVMGIITGHIASILHKKMEGKI